MCVCADCKHVIHTHRHTGLTGRLIKRTAKGGQVLFESGSVSWIPARGYKHAEAPSPWTAMPDDVLTLVLSHLTQREVACASTVCKRWRVIALSPTLWTDWDFSHVQDLSYRWVQRRFLSYGLFMKARGASARSLRLFLHRTVRDMVPLSDIQSDARSLLWYLNNFFEGIDCSHLRTVLLGSVGAIGRLHEIAPRACAARTLHTLKLYTMDPADLLVDGDGIEFTRLKCLHVNNSRGWSHPFNDRFNRFLAACPRLQELHLKESGDSRHAHPPWTLVSKSVEVLHCEGKGFDDVLALDMPSLRHCFLDLFWTKGAFPCCTHFHIKEQAHCSYDLFSSLRHLESVSFSGFLFHFPVSRGAHSVHRTEDADRYDFVVGIVPGGRIPLCCCAVCRHAEVEAAAAAAQ